MTTHSAGRIAVIFVAQRTGEDHTDYAAIRESGRNRGYAQYALHLAAITHRYDWNKSG